MSEEDDPLPAGAYDKLIDDALVAAITQSEAVGNRARSARLELAELPHYVADELRNLIAGALAAIPERDRVATARDVYTAVVQALGSKAPSADLNDRRLPAPIERLHALDPPDPVGGHRATPVPATPLRDTALFTNARGQPSVGHEIVSEIDSADRIDILMAFVRFSGIRTFLDPLRAAIDRDVPVRLITTTYTGSTEARALEALNNIGVRIRVSYDTHATRLHAKAWLFQRRSGFSTVYIGSSNLTFSAQVTGMEWNVRAAGATNPELIEAFERTFETYWATDTIEPYDRASFVEHTKVQAPDTTELAQFDLRPYPFQRVMLEQLDADRARGHRENLLVAATGTGKTIVAAFDYREYRHQHPQSRLLFIAHREEILTQSRSTFRHVLREGDFGEKWVGGASPTEFEHVFASVQSLTAGDVERIDPRHFQVVIIDEFHRAGAPTYQALLEHLKPDYLLGLTGTPERHDEIDVMRWFGGRIASELRLWDALEQQLLVPFHYFGVHDGTDLRDVSWSRARGYAANELTSVYTADDAWLRQVLAAVRRHVPDPQKMRAIGFCVSQDHAEFMARRFREAGLESVAVDARTSRAERESTLKRLRAGELRVVFTVDLYNEGVDIPTVDTLLMLRPTESSTIFLQQLGRGLRRTDGKDVLTVLDFVGNQRAEFRFDRKLGSLTGRSRKQLESDIDEGFPYLPPGCAVQLDRAASAIILRSLKHAIPTGLSRLTRELSSLGDVDLPTFLDETGVALEELYGTTRSMTELRERAGFFEEIRDPIELRLRKGLGRLQHVDTPGRLSLLERMLKVNEPQLDPLTTAEARQLEGAMLTLVGASPRTGLTIADVLERLRKNPALRREALELATLLASREDGLTMTASIREEVPLAVHGRYTREEVLAACGASSVEAPQPLRAGVYWSEPLQTDLLFVTLQKTEKEFSPRTRYRDFAISRGLFHWESQADTRAASPTGQRYIAHAKKGSSIWLFLRNAKKDTQGRTTPYFFAGPVTYLSHEGERPMQIRWRLEHPLPAEVFIESRAAVA